MHALEEFLLVRPALALGTGVEDDVVAAHARGGLAGSHEFVQGEVAAGIVGVGDVDAIGKGRVEGEGVQAEAAHPLAGAAHLRLVVVVEVPREGADLDLSETGGADRFEHVEDAATVKAAGGESDGPGIHGGRRLSRRERRVSSSQARPSTAKQKPFSSVEVQLKSTNRSTPVANRPANRRV